MSYAECLRQRAIARLEEEIKKERQRVLDLRIEKQKEEWSDSQWIAMWCCLEKTKLGELYKKLDSKL